MTNHGHLKTILLHLFVDTRPSNYLVRQLCWFCHYFLVQICHWEQHSQPVTENRW